MKIKRKVSLFSLLLPLVSSFHCRPVSIFGPFTWLESDLKFSEIEVKLISRTKLAFFPRQKLSPKGTI